MDGFKYLSVVGASDLDVAPSRQLSSVALARNCKFSVFLSCRKSVRKAVQFFVDFLQAILAWNFDF